MYKGGTSINQEVTLDTIPLFVRSDRLVPVRKAALSTAEQTDEIEFKKFSPENAFYDFYNDDGDGYAYESGAYTYKRISE